MVAYAMRWAERVRPAYVTSQRSIDANRQRAADAAIASAKAFAEGTGDPNDSQSAMPMAQEAKALAMEAINAADPAENSQAGYAARTAALTAETLAQALCAFAPASPPQADDILDWDDPLASVIDSAAMMAHSTAYNAEFLLSKCGFEERAVDDYETLIEQFGPEAGQIGTPLDVAALGPLWRSAPPEWPSGTE